MKIYTTHRLIKPQSAIDTTCEQCDSIFDLNDGFMNSSGKILCPECLSVEYTLKEALPEKETNHPGILNHAAGSNITASPAK